MTDIVERLRAAANHPYNQHGPQEWLAEAADELTRLRAENERLRAELREMDAHMEENITLTEALRHEQEWVLRLSKALRGVIRVADRNTVEFNEARAALTKGERTPSFGDFVEGCDYLPVPSTKGESHD